ncbi:MAG: flagellar motor stator protein MotA [Micavibrio sp.]|nr:flagellar motor stator protein MotA [Micavibrio sp.]|tara:strand:- start:2173 stop:3063 length:891 start_codon:yes stop_codon:yes gene_type:complete
MKFIGILLVFIFTFGGLLVAMGFDFAHFLGLLGVILKALPGEFMIIFGVAVAAFIIANSSDNIKLTLSYMKALKEPNAFSKEDYMDLLGMLYSVFKLARTKGWLAMEQHIENPKDSSVFNNFPRFAGNHHAVVFLCDYLRIISLGSENPHELEALMDEEIETLEAHESHPGHSVQTMADGIPALGIVAAVLGVIKTMASISEPPEVLGKMIGSALVGTFLGVWLSYGFVGPIAGAMTHRAHTKIMYYKCIKVGILAFLQGAAPQVAVEFARKFLPHDVQPSFQELENYVNELPAPS